MGVRRLIFLRAFRRRYRLVCPFLQVTHDRHDAPRLDIGTSDSSKHFFRLCCVFQEPNGGLHPHARQTKDRVQACLFKSPWSLSDKPKADYPNVVQISFSSACHHEIEGATRAFAPNIDITGHSARVGATLAVAHHTEITEQAEQVTQPSLPNS